jgi:CubicO group peptidase (beta-lactamase class C family)
MNAFRFLARPLCLAILALAAGSALATAPAPAASAPGHDLTAPDVETWLDGLMPMALQTAQTPGAVVVIVKDGQVLLEKGYGYADLKDHVPVDPHRTLFRPGSTSKLFTWTAVMQLVEQGQLDLDTDVNKYLDFAIPPRNGQPITLRQIMTHTSGFEETAKDLITFDEPVRPLGDVLRGYVPPRRADAGIVHGYSNYAAALAGYIVERVSKQPFDDYVEQHIFAPLKMASSSFRQPLPPALLQRMSKGYENTSKPGKGYEQVDMPPAGSLASSGDDMAHFMIAHLQDGRYQDAQILKPATAHLMHDTVTRKYPDINGIALGFYEQNINGKRVIAHAGDLNYFHTDLALFLDEHVGVFVSVNAVGKEGLGEMLRVGLFEQFADRYYPQPQPLQPLDAATAKAHAQLMAGTWVSTRRADSTFLSLIKLISPTVVTPHEDGTLTVKTLLEPLTYAEVKPFVWQEVDGHDKLQALVVDGQVRNWTTNTLAFGFEFERPGGLASAGLEMPLLCASLAILLAAAILWPATALTRRRHGLPPLNTGRRRLFTNLTGLAALMVLLAVAAWAGFIAKVSATESAHLDNLLHATQLFTLMCIGGGTVVGAWNLLLQIRDRARWPTLAWGGVRLFAFVFMLWTALSYHLISFNSQY